MRDFSLMATFLPDQIQLLYNLPFSSVEIRVILCRTLPTINLICKKIYIILTTTTRTSNDAAAFPGETLTCGAHSSLIR